MTDKKEVSILLLGIVAILAIVGLVLLFTSPAATGQAWQPPAMGPEAQYAAGPGEMITGGQWSQVRGGGGNAVYIKQKDVALWEGCPGQNNLRVALQGNIRYQDRSSEYCTWYYCPGAQTIPPVYGCKQIPGLA